MRKKRTLRFGTYSSTVTIFVLSLLLLALGLLLRSMQQMQSYSQFASSDCIMPPPCVTAHTCVIPQPLRGWCHVTLTPSPTGTQGALTCSQCVQGGTNYLCSYVPSGKHFCSPQPIASGNFFCQQCNPQVTCIPRPACADAASHPCFPGGHTPFCPPNK